MILGVNNLLISLENLDHFYHEQHSQQPNIIRLKTNYGNKQYVL